MEVLSPEVGTYYYFLISDESKAQRFNPKPFWFTLFNHYNFLKMDFFLSLSSSAPGEERLLDRASATATPSLRSPIFSDPGR